MKIDFPNHPNPYFARKDFLMLNGEWSFAISSSPLPPEKYGTIVVPFAPETPLSGVFKDIGKNDYLHYSLTLNVPDSFANHPALIHFEAVDQIADVFIDKKKVAHHEGGYLPFTVYVDSLKKGMVLSLLVKDDTDSDVFPRGKQSRNPKNIFYRPTSGIWGDVYLERLNEKGYIASMKVEPSFANRNVTFHLTEAGEIHPKEVKLYYEGELVKEEAFVKDSCLIDCSSFFRPWSMNEPNLYEAEIVCEEESVFTSFGFRKMGSKTIDGKKILTINDKPTFLSSVLDQGYWSQSGGMTPVSDEAMLADLRYLKAAGFNSIRKHIKVESPRFYHFCDQLGFLVIQDFINAGSEYSPFFMAIRPFIPFRENDTKYKKLGRKNPESRAYFEKEMEPFVSHFDGMCSVGIFTLFNEGWGQFDSTRLTKRLRDLDKDHLIDSTSGWFDQGDGDFSSHHIYFRKPRMKNDKKRILSLSEWGGFTLPIDGHIYAKKSFGYSKMRGKGDLYKHIKDYCLKALVPMIQKEGLCISVFTQLSDVEEETNGLLTYDRAITKVEASKLKELNEEMYSSFNESYCK